MEIDTDHDHAGFDFRCRLFRTDWNEMSTYAVSFRHDLNSYKDYNNGISWMTYERKEARLFKHYWN